MGFRTSKAIRPFMSDMHQKIVYVDTGIQKMNHPLLDEISDFIGLPLEIYNSSIDELEQVINRLIEESNTRK